MRALDVIVLGFLLVLSASRNQLAAQEPARRNEFTLDAGLLAGGLGYARRTGPHTLVGEGAGAGTEFRIRMFRAEEWYKTSAERTPVPDRASPSGGRLLGSHAAFGIGVAPLTARFIF